MLLGDRSFVERDRVVEFSKPASITCSSLQDCTSEH